MSSLQNVDRIPLVVQKLMPNASEGELQEATETFKQYMDVVRRIYERTALERVEADSPDPDLCGRVRNIAPNL